MAVKYFFSAEGEYLGGFEGESALALVPSDAIEVSEPPSHGLDRLDLEAKTVIPYVAPIPLSEQLNTLFEALAPETQADLAPLKAAVKLELDQHRPHIAKLIIERANIPEVLEEVRALMLSRFV